MHNFRELKIWKGSVDLALDVYNLTNSFPKKEEFILTNQIKRSVVSISSNIAEGSGKSGKKDFLRYLDIARGSAFELESQLHVANELGYINKDELNTTEKKVKDIQKMINGFKKHLKISE